PGRQRGDRLPEAGRIDDELAHVLRDRTRATVGPPERVAGLRPRPRAADPGQGQRCIAAARQPRRRAQPRRDQLPIVGLGHQPPQSTAPPPPAGGGPAPRPPPRPGAGWPPRPPPGGGFPGPRGGPPGRQPPPAPRPAPPSPGEKKPPPPPPFPPGVAPPTAT